MTLHYQPVDWPRAQALCLAFRRDAWRISYGNMDRFSEADTLAWFKQLYKAHQQRFVHVWQAGQVIGQIEYRAPIVTDKGLHGYINLLYLIPSHRRLGFGQAMMDYVLRDLHTQQCHSAHLRYIPGNIAAQRFYTQNGWQPLGQADGRGQLMVLNVSQVVTGARSD